MLNAVTRLSLFFGFPIALVLASPTESGEEGLLAQQPQLQDKNTTYRHAFFLPVFKFFEA
jgi:hypothetical protein